MLPNATKYTDTFDKKDPTKHDRTGILGRSTGLQEWKWTAIEFWMYRNQNRHSGEILNLLLVIFPSQNFDISCFYHCMEIQTSQHVQN